MMPTHFAGLDVEIHLIQRRETAFTSADVKGFGEVAGRDGAHTYALRQAVFEVLKQPEGRWAAPDAIHLFDSKLLTEGLYRLNVGAVPPGEYLFLILGSGDEKKGFLGKGYDFGVVPSDK